MHFPQKKFIHIDIYIQAVMARFSFGSRNRNRKNFLMELEPQKFFQRSSKFIVFANNRLFQALSLLSRLRLFVTALLKFFQKAFFEKKFQTFS
jgi:hypothetical protein